jgi:hypothetical protein
MKKGDLVVVWRDNGQAFLTTIRSEIDDEKVPGLIWVHGIASCYASSHVRPVTIHHTTAKVMAEIDNDFLNSTVKEEGMPKRLVKVPDIENRFTYHPPAPGQPELYEALRKQAKELAYLIWDSCPDSREKALALTALENSNMWANASIARHSGGKHEGD